MDDGTNHSDIAGDTDTGPSAPGAATDAVTPRAHQKACPVRAQRAISCPAELPECPGFLTTPVRRSDLLRAVSLGSPVYQEKPRKCNQLLANCAIYSTAVDITATSNTLAAEAIPPTRSIWPR
jgi:hypothetical protein